LISRILWSLGAGPGLSANCKERGQPHCREPVLSELDQDPGQTDVAQQCLWHRDRFV